MSGNQRKRQAGETGFQVVLVEPQIPPNTGSIARLCAATGIPLNLVEPLGFEITNSRLKRAGLDYWEFAQVSTYPSLEGLTAEVDPRDLCFFSKKAARSYLEAGFQGTEFLIFGSETAGLAEDLLARYPQRSFRIPIIQPGVRSLNLANAVAIVVYEALRQVGTI